MDSVAALRVMTARVYDVMILISVTKRDVKSPRTESVYLP